jgi:tetratricopeptide (TPR) repeat protein
LWVNRVLLAAGLAALCVGCRPTFDGKEAEIIRNAGHYQEVLARVERDTKGPLEAMELGDPLGAEGLDALHKSLPRARGLVAFDPKAFGPRLILAKILRALNQPDEAMEQYLLAVGLTPRDLSPAQAAALAGCHADMSAIHFGRRELGRAEDELREALRLAPDSLIYRINLVQVLLEARQKEEAKKILAEAEKISPQSQGVKAMKALLGQGDSPSSPPKSGGSSSGSS